MRITSLWRPLLLASLFVLWSCGDPTAVGDLGEACGADEDCVAPSSCQAGVCDPNTKECAYPVVEGYCLVANVCHLDGATADSDKCQVCDSTQSSGAFVAVTCLGDQVCDATQGCVGKENACGGDDTLCETGNVCVTGTCGDNGLCEETINDGAACDDGDACTSDDACLANGSCAGTFSCACTEDSECPVKACQTAICDEGACSYTNLDDDIGCDDLDPCTENDTCLAGDCAGTSMVCDGGDECNSPVCVEGNCTTEPLDPGTTCEDGDDCTKDDACDAAAICIGQWDDQTCSCQTTADCQATPPQCEQYLCTAGQCALEPGTDSVDCDDANACTSSEVCTAGMCGGGDAVECADDGDPCTEAKCDEKAGCVTTPIENGTTSCDDGNGCTSNDVCTAAKGQCAGEWDFSICECQTVTDCKNGQDAPPQCKKYACEAGQCVLQDAGGPCNDGDECTLNDSCAGGQCVPGGVETCANEAAPPSCQEWKCDSQKGCQLNNLTDNTDCNDGEYCSVDDKCVNGSCKGGGALICTTNDPCKTPLCDEVNDQCKVEAKAAGAACNPTNPNVCWSNTQCNINGQCKPTDVLQCTPTNPCKESTCDSEYECIEDYLPNKADGTVCGSKKACSNGVCSSVQCNSSNDCTAQNECALWSCQGNKCVQQGSLTNGKPCGKTSMDVCYLGSCKTAECLTDKACVGDPCKVFECQAYECVQTQSFASGTCGTKKVCQNGVCTSVQCTSDSHCTSKNLCKVGGCAKNNACVYYNKADNLSCGTSSKDICKSGTCLTVDCTKNSHCTTTNDCETVACNSSNTCYVSANKQNGYSCGKNGVCIVGKCEAKQCSSSSNCPQYDCEGYICTQYYQCQANTSKKIGSYCKSGKIAGKCALGTKGIYCKIGSIIPGGPIPNPK